MSKGGSTQTTTQKSDPWKPAQGALKDILGQAGSLYGQGSSYYPFSTVVPFSNQTNSALQGIESKASGPNDIASSASGSLQSLLGGNPYLTGTANGDFLNSNPYLDQMFGHAAGQVRDQVNSNFSMAGRSGDNGAHSGAITQGLGNLANQIYGQNYANERQNMVNAGGTIGQQQLGALSQAGGINDLGYSDLNKLLGVGSAYEAQAGNTLQDLMKRFDFSQNSGWDQLQKYLGIVNPIASAGGTSTQTAPNPNSGLGSILSPIASIAGLASGLPLGGLFGSLFGGGTNAITGR